MNFAIISVTIASVFVSYFAVSSEQPEQPDKVVVAKIERRCEEVTTGPVIEGNIWSKAGSHGGQCVTFIQNLFKKYNTEFRGRAVDIQPNEDSPAVGRVVLTNESYVGHVAAILAIEGDYLVLAESNYGMDEKVTVGRKLDRNSEVIRGYFSFEQTKRVCGYPPYLAGQLANFQ